MWRRAYRQALRAFCHAPCHMIAARFPWGIMPTHTMETNMAQRVDPDTIHHPLEAAFAALIEYGLYGAGEALL